MDRPRRGSGTLTRAVWLFLIALACIVTLRLTTVALPPMGDEFFGIMLHATVLLALAVPASAFRPRVLANPLLFASLMWVGDLVMWYKVATRYDYYFFGQQLVASLMFPVALFIIVLLWNLVTRAAWQHLWPRAT